MFNNFFSWLGARSEYEGKTNIAVVLKFNIAEILKHKEVAALFEKLKKHKGFKFQNLSEWTESLIENYKKKYSNQLDYTEKNGVRYVWETVRFNIINNTLWINDKISFKDCIWHQIIIPYEYKGNKEEEGRIFHPINECLKIRVFAVNGLIKLQIGNFDKSTTPNVIKEAGFWKVYQNYSTVTFFPLMYISQNIPADYLNFSMYATKSYTATFNGDFQKMQADWGEIKKEVGEYNYIRNELAFNLADNLGLGKKCLRLLHKFHKKGAELLAQEKFLQGEQYDDWMPKWQQSKDIEYNNNYLEVSISNYRLLREFQATWLTDYYEERP